MLFRVIVEMLKEPTGITMLVGLASMLKSPITVRTRVAERVNGPPVPFIVMV